MKRQTAMALAAVFAMSVAGTALAAPANPFVDVPAKHWAYDSINKLAQAGVISGYGDGTYVGDKNLTRYEVATIVAKAMANSEKADAATQKEIEALKAEFGTELNNLGVRVDNLESKVGNVKLTGNVRIRYDNKDYDNANDNTMKARARIYGEAKINDQWKANFRFEGTQDMRESGAEDSNDLNLISVTGPLLGTKATFGRFEAMPVYGLVYDSTVDGAAISFGNKLKTTLIYGKEDNKFGGENVDAGVAIFGYAASKATNLNAAYYVLDSDGFDAALGDDQLKVWEFGFDTKVAKNLVAKASYAKSDADDEDTAYQAGLWYKGANIQNEKSFGVWAQYLNIEDLATWDTTNSNVSSTRLDGSKGIELGFGYVPAKNILMRTWYFDGEDTTTSDLDKKFIRSQVEFFF